MNYARKLDIGLLCPNMEIRPRASKNGIFQKFFIFVERSPDFASNEPSTTPDIKFKSSYARKRDFGLLCPNMEIQPQAPKNGIFQKIFIFLIRYSDFASNEPSTTCRQFKSSYARKHIIKKFESRTQLLNPEQGKTSPLLKGSMIIILLLEVLPGSYNYKSIIQKSSSLLLMKQVKTTHIIIVILSSTLYSSIRYTSLRPEGGGVEG